MAEEKIPSPQDIKSGPQKFTEEELNNLRELQARTNQLTNNFGQLYLAKNRIEEQESILKGQLSSLQKEEATLAKSLSDKYGQGSLDIETGTFIPAE